MNRALLKELQGNGAIMKAHEAENEAHGLTNLDGSSARCRSIKFELDDILNSQERLAAFIQQCVFLLSGYQRQLNGEAGQVCNVPTKSHSDIYIGL